MFEALPFFSLCYRLYKEIIVQRWSTVVSLETVMLSAFHIPTSNVPLPLNGAFVILTKCQFHFKRGPDSWYPSVCGRTWFLTAHWFLPVLSLPSLYLTAWEWMWVAQQPFSTCSDVTLWIRHRGRPCGFDFNHGSDSLGAVESYLQIPPALLLAFIAQNQADLLLSCRKKTI